MSDPYQPPSTPHAGAASEADSKIRFVVTMFTFLSWLLALFLVPSALIAVAAMLYIFLFSPGDNPLPTAAIVVIPIGAAASIGIALCAIRLSQRMKDRDPTAIRPARILCVIGSVVAFPVGTLIGIFFIGRLNRFYVPYCSEARSSTQAEMGR